MRHNTTFYIPLYYTITTRLIGYKHLLSWVIIYFIPILFIFMLYDNAASLNNITISLLSVVLIYNNYELGYIYNDAERIKKEESPTIRLNASNLHYYELNKFKITICRIIYSLILSFIIYHITGSFLFIFLAWSILFFYGIYNSIFSIWNLFFHSILVSLRYCSIAFLFGGIGFNLIFLFFLFPFPNILERAAEKKFGILPFIYLQKIDRFRFYYYLFLFLVVFSLNLFFMHDLNVYMLVFSFYYLIYRGAVCFLNLRK